MQREHVAGSPLVTTEGGRKASIGGATSVGGRRMSGVIPSPSGRRGSGSVVTPGGQVVAYHTRTNVSFSRFRARLGLGDERSWERERGEGVRRRDRRTQGERKEPGTGCGDRKMVWYGANRYRSASICGRQDDLTYPHAEKSECCRWSYRRNDLY